MKIHTEKDINLLHGVFSKDELTSKIIKIIW